MLDPWIIEQIRRREEDDRERRREQPAVEMPHFPDQPHDRGGTSDDSEKPVDRGVTIIDFRI